MKIVALYINSLKPYTSSSSSHCLFTQLSLRKNPNFAIPFSQRTLKEMAFCNKLSGLLRQGVVSQSSNVPMTSMLGSLRYISTTKLYVIGLPLETDDITLCKAFCKFGNIIEAKVLLNRELDRELLDCVFGPRRCGYIRFEKEDSATNARDEMDGKELNGRIIKVHKIKNLVNY